MNVYAGQNLYQYPSSNVNFIDKTILKDDTRTPEPVAPRFTVLIPTIMDRGTTNVLERYYSGEANRFMIAHGAPNMVKFGVGPDLIRDILSNTSSGVGVYTINLRSDDAANANIMVLFKYKVNKAVPMVNEKGEPLYMTPDGVETITATGNTAIVRDMLVGKFVTESVTGIKHWSKMQETLNIRTDTTPDADGFKTIPFFSIMYRGASNYGNNTYLRLIPKKNSLDNYFYYSIELYDGENIISSDYVNSFDPNAGAKYNTSYFIENQFNEVYPTLWFKTSDYSNDVISLINSYLGTKTINNIDIFDANEYQYVTDDKSLDITAQKSMSLINGTDGTISKGDLMKKFYDEEIIEDLTSIIRYKFNFIPDIGYDNPTKTSISSFVKKRIRTTTFARIVGGDNTFLSAINDRTLNYFNDEPNVYNMTKAQSPMMYNTVLKRNMVYPITYFMTLALINSIALNGNPYTPLAGADARISGYIEDTMVYPANKADLLTALNSNRINVVMKDNRDGSYLHEQNMNTNLTSDQTEFNNALMISDMLYDLFELIHVNNYKFNEPAEVLQFKAKVSEQINANYAQHSASLSVDVYRQGTVGRAKYTNQIVVRVNMRDINKYTDIDFILTDE